jgi:hypothetical protein
MFFIGGLNSVIPYIIYLSLVWVFLIIGFSGKVFQARQLLSSRVYRAEKHSLQHYDQRLIYFYSHTTEKPKQTVQKALTVAVWNYFFPAEPGVMKFVIQSYPVLDQHPYSFNVLRGPPSSVFTS